MVFVVFLNNVSDGQLWQRLGLFGNYIHHVFMTKNNVLAVVLCDMMQQEHQCLDMQLLNVWLFVKDIPYEQLAQMKAGSETRMASFLLGPMFVPPPSNQRHLLKPLCDHAGLTLDKVAGTCSVAGVVMALQYALARGLVAIGVI
jgi:hypothetical protein